VLGIIAALIVTMLAVSAAPAQVPNTRYRAVTTHTSATARQIRMWSPSTGLTWGATLIRIFALSCAASRDPT
jgi:hypothetical protein